MSKQPRLTMLFNEIRIQFRKYLYPAIAGILALAVCDGIALICETDSAASSIALSIRMLVWCFIVCYFAFELFRYGNGANDYLLLTLLGNKTTGLRIKAWTFFCILSVLTILESPILARSLPTSLKGGDLLKVLVYDRFSRLLGIAAFILIILVGAYLSFVFRKIVVSAITTVGTYVAVTIAEICVVLVPRLHHQNTLAWAVGYNTAFKGASQHINILPIMVWNSTTSTNTSALGTMTFTVIVANLLLIIVFYLLWKWIIGRVPVNYIK